MNPCTRRTLCHVGHCLLASGVCGLLLAWLVGVRAGDERGVAFTLAAVAVAGLLLSELFDATA